MLAPAVREFTRAQPGVPVVLGHARLVRHIVHTRLPNSAAGRFPCSSALPVFQGFLGEGAGDHSPQKIVQGFWFCSSLSPGGPREPQRILHVFKVCSSRSYCIAASVLFRRPW
jgi:hypothetical protein